MRKHINAGLSLVTAFGPCLMGPLSPNIHEILVVDSATGSVLTRNL